MTSNYSLLVFAAKAGGVEVKSSPNGEGLWVATRTGGVLPWNPLADDGDAFRLAVKRGIKFRYNEALGQALAWDYSGVEWRANVEDFGNDPNAAARNAITRAAAQDNSFEKPNKE